MTEHDGRFIVELKTAKALAEEPVAQVLGYLKSARLEHGLLINFGSYKFEMRKFAWSQDGTCRQEQAHVPFVRCLCVLCGLIDEEFCLAPSAKPSPKYRLRRWSPVPILPTLFERKLTLCVVPKASKQKNPWPNVSKSPQRAKCWAPTPAGAICSPQKTRNVAAGWAKERSLTKPTPIASFKTSPSATDATV